MTTKAISPALFTAIVASFFLPFAIVSCEADRTEVRGVHLATGIAPPVEGASGERPTDDSLGQSAADGGARPTLIALLAAVAGVAIALRRGRHLIALAATAWIGTLALLWLGARFDFGGGDEHSTIEPRYGYWVATGLFATAALAHTAAALHHRVARRLRAARRGRLLTKPSA
jgi:hypothetical protein